MVSNPNESRDDDDDDDDGSPSVPHENALPAQRPSAKVPPQDATRVAKSWMKRSFTERFKTTVRHLGAQASLGDVRAPSGEVAHELESRW